MFGSSFIAKGKAAALKNYGNEAERAIGPCLYDDDVQEMSSFEMNKFASLTYGTQVCVDVFNLLGDILASPADPTVLTLQKTLVLFRHLVIYGSEDAVVQARGMGHLVSRLLNFNTVLHTAAGNSLLLQFKGGAVDEGGPVREAAAQAHRLLSRPQDTIRLRARHADPTSLVPVGDVGTLLFRSDRRALRVEQEGARNGGHVPKSNLVKQTNGFGSGYNAKGGRTVVGAAHSIEEMIAVANKEKLRYVDDVNDPVYQQRQAELEKVRMNLYESRREQATQQQLQQEKIQEQRRQERETQMQQVDLLDFGGTYAPTQAQHPPIQQPTLDIFDVPISDNNGNAAITNGVTSHATQDLMGLSSVVAHDPFAAAVSSNTISAITSSLLPPIENNNSNTNYSTSASGQSLLEAMTPTMVISAIEEEEATAATNIKQNIMGAVSSTASKAFSALDAIYNAKEDNDTNNDTNASVFDDLPSLTQTVPTEALSLSLSSGPPPIPSEAPPPPPSEPPPPPPAVDTHVGFNSYSGGESDDANVMGGVGPMGGSAPPMGQRSLLNENELVGAPTLNADATSHIMGGLGPPTMNNFGASTLLLPTGSNSMVPPTSAPPQLPSATSATNNPLVMPPSSTEGGMNSMMMNPLMMQQQMMMMQSMTPEQQQQLMQQQMMMMQTMMMNMNKNSNGNSDNQNSGNSMNGNR